MPVAAAATGRRARYLVGGYGADMGGSATGILALGQDTDGSLYELGLSAEVDSAAFLARRGDVLYAVGEASALLHAYRLSPAGHLDELGAKTIDGTFPCHIDVMPEAVIVSCYGDGGLLLFPTLDGGEPLSARQRIDPEGTPGPRPQQDSPHAHSSLTVGEYVVTADLGTDTVYLHRMRDGELVRVSALQLPPGSGPRHIVQHPSGYLYVIAELSNELYALALEEIGGRARLRIESGTPLTLGASDRDQAAEIALSRDGTRAYAGIRGTNAIAVLSIGGNGERIAPLDLVSSEGDWPRHHVVDGDLLHVANERSSGVASFRLDPRTGVPRLIRSATPVPTPTYLLPLA